MTKSSAMAGVFIATVGTWIITQVWWGQALERLKL